MKINIISKTYNGELAINRVYKEDNTIVNKWALKKAKIKEDILLDPYRLVIEYKDPKFLIGLKICRDNNLEEYKAKLKEILNKMILEMNQKGAIKDIDYLIEVKYVGK